MRPSHLLLALASLLATACIVPTQPAQPGGGTGGGYAQPEATGGTGDGYAQPEATGDADQPSAPAAPSVVSVTLRSSCGNTVRVFFGDKPKFGSGTYSTMSSNSRTSKQFGVGDMMWIVDESDNGIASATIDDRTREIEITSSCTSLSVN